MDEQLPLLRVERATSLIRKKSTGQCYFLREDEALQQTSKVLRQLRKFEADRLDQARAHMSINYQQKFRKMKAMNIRMVRNLSNSESQPDLASASVNTVDRHSYIQVARLHNKHIAVKLASLIRREGIMKVQSQKELAYRRKNSLYKQPLIRNAIVQMSRVQWNSPAGKPAKRIISYSLNKPNVNSRWHVSNQIQ